MAPGEARGAGVDLGVQCVQRRDGLLELVHHGFRITRPRVGRQRRRPSDPQPACFHSPEPVIPVGVSVQDPPPPRPARRLPGKRRLAMFDRLLRGISGRMLVRTRPPLVRGNLPATAGRLEILRDRNGVPHVYAEVETDLFAALGYLQAADRFVLLDLLRHAGAGRICELVGNFRIPVGEELFGRRRVSDVDAFLRPLGFEREAERDAARLSPEARACLEAFSRGVNAGLEAMRGIYPAEYLLLGRVRPWRPADSLLVQRTSGFTVSLVNLDNELGFDAVRARLGDDVARRLYPEAPWGDVPTSYAAPGLEPPEPPVHVPGVGSNNWAVDGSRSASGAPIVANDPHVPLFPLPTSWYHAHLEGPDYRVQGGVFPGCPIFGFGHNGHLAWGCTTGFRDGWDLFRVHRLPGDPGRYRTPEGSGEIARHRERARVRLGRSVDLEWESCEHGILYPGWKHHDGTDLALRFVSADLARYFEGYLALAASKSVGEHRAALALINEGPFDFNHVYAHRDGHIGWEIFGRLPRRARDGLFVRDAHDPAAQWQGFLPFEEMPKRLNPEEGYVASANSVVDSESFRSIATLSHFEPRYRQDRIEARLSASRSHDVGSFAALQADVGSDYAPALRDAVLPMLARHAREETACGRAYRLLAEWDGVFATDRAAPAVYHFFTKALAKHCFEPLLGDATHRYTDGRRCLPRLHRLLLDPDDPLRGDIERASGRALGDLACEAFAQAVTRLVGLRGEEVSAWRWGTIQRARLGTLFSEIPFVGRWFLALDAPFPGDDYTVSPSRPLDEGHRLRAFVGASSRFVCDLARPDEALFAHTSGPSADVGSLFYANLSEPWQRFEYFRSALWRADEVPDVVERVLIE